MLDKQSVKTVVTFVEAVPGHPSYLVFFSRLRNTRGREKVLTQQVDVLDADLFQQILAQAVRGDEIEVTITTDWGKPGSPTYLTAFCKRDGPTPSDPSHDREVIG